MPQPCTKEPAQGDGGAGRKVAWLGPSDTPCTYCAYSTPRISLDGPKTVICAVRGSSSMVPSRSVGGEGCTQGWGLGWYREGYTGCTTQPS